MYVCIYAYLHSLQPEVRALSLQVLGLHVEPREIGLATAARHGRPLILRDGEAKESQDLPGRFRDVYWRFFGFWLCPCLFLYWGF